MSDTRNDPTNTVGRPTVLGPQRELFKNQFLRLYSVKASFPTQEKEYFVVDRGQVAAVLVHDGGSILLVRQYRFVIDDFSWEIPAGGVDSGESAALAGRRECIEEAGIDCASMEPLMDVRLGVDTTDGVVHVFESDNFVDNGFEPNGETLERTWIPIDRCLEMVFNNQIVHPITVTALLAFAHKRD